MARGRNKHQSRENRARVRDLFLREWDPIGIFGEGPNDEYNSYADKAYAMLMAEGADEATIAAYLHRIATDHMGLYHSDGLRARSERTASLLVAMRPEFETR
ncbi:MAG TPA: hypothetical protein VHL98_03565 [Microvirga sp.]|jgi:hypothetical protein|nr:hypothetical protein [Microvirga sp.]